MASLSFQLQLPHLHGCANCIGDAVLGEPQLCTSGSGYEVSTTASGKRGQGQIPGAESSLCSHAGNPNSDLDF